MKCIGFPSMGVAQSNGMGGTVTLAYAGSIHETGMTAVRERGMAGNEGMGKSSGGGV